MRPLRFLIVLVVVPAIGLFITVLSGFGSTNPASRTAWYCSDDGRPRHLEQPRVGVHVCTNGELHDAGFWSGIL
jgi:hypothetical protein